MVMYSRSYARKLATGQSRAGGDKRGSSAARKARKGYLLTLWGDGETCGCLYCDKPLDFTTVEADRIIAGGSYARDNVIPACRECNVARLDKSLWAFSPRVARRLHRKGFIVSAK
jgi:hypothetical protein